MNLAQVDAAKMILISFPMSQSIGLPFLLLYLIVMLFKILGVSFFTSMVLFALGFYVNKFIVKHMKRFMGAMMKAMDHRMNYTNEAIQNIKALKFYSWTEVFETEIIKRREL